MVGKVLRNHGIVEKVHDKYVLRDFSNLSEEQIAELIQICNQKLTTYIEKRTTNHLRRKTMLIAARFLIRYIVR